MADNYIERKMEEYRSGTRLQHSTAVSPAGNRKGYVSLPLDVSTVFIAGYSNAPEIAEALVRTFGNAGCSVGFDCLDIKMGRALAQTTSSRHYPLAAELAIARFREDKGDVDLLVEVLPGRALLRRDEWEYTAAGTPGQIADTALVLMLKAASALRASVGK